MRGKIVYGNGRTIADRYFVNGVEVTKAEYDEAFPRKIDPLLAKQCPANVLMETSKAWPRKSDSVGVHPGQKKKAEAQLAEMGVPTEFDAKDGRAIIRNNAHQLAVMKAMRWHNNDGGYGQVTG